MKYTILVVDDTEANRYVLSRCLTQGGFEVIEASNGRGALDQMASKPDLVVLDVKLPDIDGLEICRRIKSDPETRNVLVMNVSASYTTKQARINGLENGADSYLTQPLEPNELLATVHSLLRLRDAERLANRREARYRALVEASSQAVWAIDDQGKVSEEHGLSALFGRPVPVGADGAWLDSFIADDAAGLQASWRAAFNASQPWEGRGQIQADSGQGRHLHLRVVPWRDRPDGPVIEWIGAAIDLSAMVEAEKLVAEKVAELARSNQYLEHFAYVLSHDLQEPLRTITMYLDLMRQKTSLREDAKAQHYFSYIADSAKRMRQLITGVLQYSTVTRSSNREPVPLGEALAEALANLAPLVTSKGARVTSDELPTVDADRTQLIQLFQNLIANSLKYCAQAVPEVRITARVLRGQHHIAVSDNGIGMEPEHLHRVFELFHRLHSHEHYEGTGIGLALCRRIVEHHGGTIWAESTAGAGSTFTFTLPVLAG